MYFDGQPNHVTTWAARCWIRAGPYVWPLWLKAAGFFGHSSRPAQLCRNAGPHLKQNANFFIFLKAEWQSLHFFSLKPYKNMNRQGDSVLLALDNGQRRSCIYIEKKSLDTDNEEAAGSRCDWRWDLIIWTCRAPVSSWQLNDQGSHLKVRSSTTKLTWFFLSEKRMEQSCNHYIHI